MEVGSGHGHVSQPGNLECTVDGESLRGRIRVDGVTRLRAGFTLREVLFTNLHLELAGVDFEVIHQFGGIPSLEEVQVLAGE